MLTFGSLFAGAGGFEIGLEAAGMTCQFQVEIDATARAVLAKHWPGMVRREDVRECGKKNLPKCDVLTFGFPCQDLSVAGQRKGLQGGTRSGLFYEAVRIGVELRCGVLVFENVPGLLSSDDGRDFARVLRHLGDSGFHGAWRVLDAQHFGLAQRRKRVFGVFARGRFGAERCAEVLALKQSVQGDTSASRGEGEGFTRRLAQCLRASGVGTERAGDTRGQDNVIAHCVTGHMAGGSKAMLGFSTSTHTTALGATQTPAVQRGLGVRRLTPRECERLQGWPDDHTRYREDGSEIADGPRYRLIGNGVASPCAEWIGRRLINH